MKEYSLYLAMNRIWELVVGDYAWTFIDEPDLIKKMEELRLFDEL